MSSSKTQNQFALLGKAPESPYGTPLALSAAADGILLTDFAEPDFSAFIHDGARGRAPGGGTRTRVAPSGQIGSLSCPAEAIGGGAAYSASVVPSVHTLLRTSGLSATVDVTPSAENWKYRPEVAAADLEAGTFEYYEGGQKYPLTGAYSSFTVGVDGPDVPRWVFDLLGIGARPTDAALPVVSGGYPPASRLPPKAESVAFTLGLFTGGVVRSFEFNYNRAHDAQRRNINSGGHAGYTPGGFNPTLTVTLEQATLATVTPWSTASTINPYALRDTGDLVVCSLAVGSVQYNRWKLHAGNTPASAQAQVVDVQDELDGPTKLWTITLELRPSAYGLVDQFTVSFD